LQIFGTYSYPHYRLLNALYNAQLPSLPMVIGWTCTNEHSYGVIDSFTVFPTLYSADCNATNHQILVDFLNKDLTCAEIDQVSHFALYLNPSNIPTIHALAKDMAVIFPQIVCLYLNFECQCASEITEIVSFLLTHDVMVAFNRRVYRHYRI
jgi:hypothetical protein